MDLYGLNFCKMEKEFKKIALQNNCQIQSFSKRNCGWNGYLEIQIKYPDSSIGLYKDKYFRGFGNYLKVLIIDFDGYLKFTIKHFGTK